MLHTFKDKQMLKTINFKPLNFLFFFIYFFWGGGVFFFFFFFFGGGGGTGGILKYNTVAIK